MLNERLQVFGILSLFAIAVALLAISWAIHDYAHSHQRYELIGPQSGALRFDRTTGELQACSEEGCETVLSPWR
jgi:hypothetical protein